MKVLFLINSLNVGGAEKLVTDLAIAINKNKRNVFVDVVCLYDCDSHLKTFLLENNVKYDFLGTKKHSIKYIKKIRKLSKNYDIVHSHLFPSDYYAPLGCKKIPKIATLHNTTTGRRKNFIFRRIDDFFYNKCTNIIAVSPEVKKSFKSSRSFKRDPIVIHNAIDLELYKNAQPYEKSDFFDGDSFIITMIARFSDAKRQSDLIRALSVLPINFKAIFCGSGDTLNREIELAKNIGVSDRVAFLGTRDDVSRILKTSDMAFHGANFEGFGLVIAEAMAAGLPVVMSDLSVLRKFSKDGDSFYQNDDIQSLSKKILKISSSNDMKSTIDKNLKTIDKYSLETCAINHIELYMKSCKLR